VLNLVLTLFCQGNEEEIHDFEIVGGKAKNNLIPIMLIGQGGEEERLAEAASFRITIKSVRHTRGIITTNEQQYKRKAINKNSHSYIKHPTGRKTASLFVLLCIFCGRSGIIKFYRRHAEDTRPYFKSTVDTFSRWFKDAVQSVCKQRLCLHFGMQNIEFYSTTICIFMILKYNKLLRDNNQALQEHKMK
jgi:hypothetical protein